MAQICYVPRSFYVAVFAYLSPLQFVHILSSSFDYDSASNVSYRIHESVNFSRKVKTKIRKTKQARTNDTNIILITGFTLHLRPAGIFDENEGNIIWWTWIKYLIKIVANTALTLTHLFMIF